LTIFFATAFIAVVSTLVVYVGERHAQGTETPALRRLPFRHLAAPPRLLGRHPSYDFGKVLELFFDIWAIIVVAPRAGSFAAFFHARSKEMDGIERRLQTEVEELRERL
jgi:hypothetical protein